MEGENKPGISYTKRPTHENVNSLKSLCQLAPPKGQENDWVVCGFALNQAICRKDLTPDNEYGLFILLGYYPTEVLARKRAEHITKTTGARVCITKFCHWAEWKLLSDSEYTTMIKEDVGGKLAEYDEQEFRRQQEKYKKKYEEEKAILHEQEKEVDPEDIAHYKQQWILAIQNFARLKMYHKKVASIEETYQHHIQKIRNHYTRHPNHDEEWLEYLKDLDYTEAQIECIQNAYFDLRKEILEEKGDCDPNLEELSEEEDPPTSVHLAASLPEIPLPLQKQSSSEDSPEEQDPDWHKVSKNKRRRARRRKTSQ